MSKQRVVGAGLGLVVALCAAPARAEDVPPGYGQGGYEQAPIVDPAVARTAVGEAFYDALAPHGRWRYTSDHGWGWSPRAGAVGRDFQPYLSEGEWVLSNEGWMFNSAYNWGWAPFHYGRWYRDPSFGWTWLPGEEWAPAWVDWRSDDEYVGWAPLGPGDQPIDGAWYFVGAAYLGRPNIARYIVPRHRWSVLLRRTARLHRGDRRWAFGPRILPGSVRRVQIVAPRRGVAAAVRVQGDRVAVYPRGSVTVRRHYRPSGAVPRYRDQRGSGQRFRESPRMRREQQRGAPQRDERLQRDVRPREVPRIDDEEQRRRRGLRGGGAVQRREPGPRGRVRRER